MKSDQLCTRKMKKKALRSDNAMRSEWFPYMDLQCLLFRSTRGNDQSFRVRVGVTENTILCREMLILMLARWINNGKEASSRAVRNKAIGVALERI